MYAARAPGHKSNRNATSWFPFVGQSSSGVTSRGGLRCFLVNCGIGPPPARPCRSRRETGAPPDSLASKKLNRVGIISDLVDISWACEGGSRINTFTLSEAVEGYHERVPQQSLLQLILSTFKAPDAWSPARASAASKVNSL